MAENIYLNNRLKYHTASRVAISTAQSMMQATNGDGHTVTSAQIWSAANNQFPKNTSDYAESSNVVGATKDLVAVFKNGNQYEITHVLTTDAKFVEGKDYYTKQIVNEEETYVLAAVVADTEITETYYETILAKGLTGKVYRNDDFPAVELYEGVEMTDVQYSDKQAWEIKVAGSRIMDWCSPTAVKNGVLPVPGYTGYAEASDNGTTWTILQDSPNKSYGWSLAGGNWEFVYMSGMLTFHPDYIPSAMSFSKVRFTGFKYIGTYLTENITNIQEDITTLQNEIGNTVNVGLSKTLAIKPCVFEFSKMTKISTEEMVLTEDVVVVQGKIYYERIEQIAVVEGETVTEVTYLQKNLTVGQEIPENIYERIYRYVLNVPGFVFQTIQNNTGIIIGEVNYLQDGSSQIVFDNFVEAPFLGTEKFTTYVLVNKDGTKLQLLSPENL